MSTTLPLVPMAHLHPHRGVNWDGVGASASLACALHCAALPLVFGLLPGIQAALGSAAPQWTGLTSLLLWGHEAERSVVSVVLLFAAVVLGLGLQRHRQRRPLVVAACASVLMIIGAFGHWDVAERSHVLFQVGGGLGIAFAHLLNLRALHRCAHASIRSVEEGLASS